METYAAGVGLRRSTARTCAKGQPKSRIKAIMSNMSSTRARFQDFVANIDCRVSPRTKLIGLQL